ncbi:SDR family oxidoreductase [Actinosynnema sp. NPDC047251]|uniref:Putative oxidoreductase n=1 Tax=Saccharothrix espanaensis (strain ATCC 51144 / DSM 44229 / JCM 9112 / NBRC 15066 / NRRL 15764) TaxID=1179773 RepID=K0K586_SACES|nr:SDR family oxidoreductase [Saccharothrix espanaensis]CCH35440.1 putative oxidoreductase [Saccharothrix espanaensis DSM 44229]
MGQLDGRTALVTGGSRGIGAAVATRLAHDGANVAITYASARDRADAVVATLGNAIAIRAEASDSADLRAAVAETVETFGGLDILVNNAGIAVWGPFEETSDDDVDRLLAVHARAAFVLAKAASPHLPTGGRIITIGSSLAERVPVPGWAAYSMSKAALVGLTKGLARDLGPRGITVNLVHPGSTDTEMNPADGPDAAGERAFTALDRYCDPEDVAAMVAHLAGPGGHNITGAAFLVDAGAVA